MSDRQKQLQAEGSRLQAERSQFLATWDTEDRGPTSEEQSRCEEISRRLRAIDHEAEREAQLNAPSTPVTQETFGSIADSPMVNGISTGQSGARASSFFARHTPGVRPTFAGLFPNVAIESGGFRDMEEFFQVLDRGVSDSRLFAVMTEGVPSDGGFFVPTQFSRELFDKGLEGSVFASKVRIEPMTSDEKKISSFDAQSSASGTLFGGLLPAWEGEASTLTESTPKMRQIFLRAKKLILYSTASNELVADGTSFEEQLGQIFVKAMAWTLDEKCIRGTGVGMPLGLLNSDSLITVAKEVGQAANTIVYENAVSMYSRIAPSLINETFWFASPTAIPQLLTMSLTIGTGGSAIQVLKEESGAFSLLGRPLFTTEKCSALGTVGDIILAAPREYVLGMRSEVAVEKSMHVGFANDTSAYRGKLRADGMPSWDSVFTPSRGDTLSWAVTLAART